MSKLSKEYFQAYLNQLDLDWDHALNEVKSKEWTVENFRFFTAVSVMSSSRIEGEALEIDSYLRHKINGIEYLDHLTERPNDLYTAYEFARDNPLNLNNFLKSHSLATKHLLPSHLGGKLRTNNMVILDQKSQQIQYEAANASLLESEFEDLWNELETLLNQKLSIPEIFYYASLIHLVFVKIHPFCDGNGRTARLLEKWFLSHFLGEKAWFIASEHYYYEHLSSYYKNLARIGLFYEQLNFEESVPFLMMLPNALQAK